MFQPSTALIALTTSLINPNLFQLLATLQIQIKNKLPVNTKEGILLELEGTKPTYELIYSGLPGVVGIEEIITKSKQLSPKTKIVLVINEGDSQNILNYLLLNVDAIIWKDNFTESLDYAIKQLAKGQLFMCGKTTQEIKTLLQQKNIETKFDLGLLGLLTDRELEVLHSLTQGRNYKQIAQLLFISESTVKTHINNIFTKLNVNDRTQAVLYALNHGIESLIKKPHVVTNLVNEVIQK